MTIAACKPTADKIINFNEARGPDPGFRHRWLDRLQDDPERRQSTFSVAYALARRIDPKKASPEVWPGIELIAATAQVSISTAKTELKWLHDRGWLAFGKRRPKYVVRVLTMPVVADPPATTVADPPATITTTRSSPPTKEDNNRHAAGAADARAVDRSPKAAPVAVTAKPSRNPGMHRQSMVEANRAFAELQKLEGWGGTFGEGEAEHWRDLLRKGHAAEDIVDVAFNFLRRTPHLALSLGDWLACFESYLEDDDDATSPMHHATAANDHHAHA